MHDDQVEPIELTVESIQVGAAMPTPASSVGVTSIDKKSIDHATVVAEGLVDDSISDTEHHGGPDQAVYIYFRDDYKHWEEELGKPLAGGAFGENITIAGVSSSEIHVGDQFTSLSRRRWTHEPGRFSRGASKSTDSSPRCTCRL